jgi:hypothetical protein
MLLLNIFIYFLLQAPVHAQEPQTATTKTEQVKDWAKRQMERMRLQMEKSHWPSLSDMGSRIALKAGPSISYRTLHADFNTEDHFVTPGINTQVSISFTNQWHLALQGHIFMGKNDKLEYELNGQRLPGQGSYSSVSFGPVIQYIFEQEIKPTWHYYIKTGPLWSMQSLKLQPFRDNQGVIRSQHKVTYESGGAMIGLGVEEILPYKKLHPVYVELVFKYMQGRKITLVDASDFTEVERVSYDDRETQINGFTLLLNMGITVF